MIFPGGLDPATLRTGDRVKLLKFWIDEGLRMWPTPGGQDWRVVEVRAQAARELFVGSQEACMSAYPKAVYGINDNEIVPPGTLGTVDSYTSTQVGVRWDNGSRLGLTTRDVAVKISSQEGGTA